MVVAHRSTAPLPPASKPAGPGRPKDPEKRQAILDAAKRLFAGHGFDGSSMDAIAAEAGVSKLTVYSHFTDKDTLFAETIKLYCEAQMPSALFLVDLKGTLRRQMLTIARGFFRLITSDEAIALHRLMTSQPPASRKLGQLYWEAGPRRIQQAFEQFLAAEVAAGQLEIPDLHRAGAQFFSLLKGEPHAQMLFNCCERAGERDIAAHLQATVDLFLRAYAPRGKP